MNIERIRNYAKESGLSEKRIAELVKLLHPTENGELDTAEAMCAMVTVAEIARARECTRKLVESVRAHRAQGEQK